jgi:DNA-binding transcriptional ArsR family regulator
MRMSEYEKSEPLDDDLASLAVEIFRMLADGTRIRLLWALTGGEFTVSALAELIGKPQPTVSQHLAKLRMARLVQTRREGAQIFYSLENEHIERLVTDAIYNAEHAQPGVPTHHRDSQLRVVEN